MANNNFKAFAAAAGANVMTQADYEALAALLTGFQSGTAQSQQLNKVWRQSSIMASVLAQFIVDLTGQDAIDDGTTTTLLANLKTAVQAQSAAVVGHARNLAMSVTAASATATLTADEIVVGTALGGKKYVLGAFNQTINLATTGAGGMDTGAAPAPGYVGLYAGYNPVTGARTLFARNATSTVLGSVYGGANAPAGITATALVSVWPTNSSGQFVVGAQTERSVKTGLVTVLATNSIQSSYIALNISSAVPKNAITCSGYISYGSSAASMGTMNFAADATGTGAVAVGGYSNGSGSVYAPFADTPINIPQTAYYNNSSASGTPTFGAAINGYKF
ncbi:hypothetical protein WM29_23060 [Burkholderia ubonensis]|uniref:hypothetical protein n=1 Tax=Burkholderia ubonensis TaxID=101571 RepID=UPI0008422941|nr:hypothetical protein [Burkholderia ubonensis]AOK62011.1 hypothetical protein WM29_23060 [Burkholderia ubonensis]